jgi:diguanylate cyclase (GGDEF)-like protein
MSVLVFGTIISLKDFMHGEQILVFITVNLFVACLFMIKPYLAILLIVIPFGIFYYLMGTTNGISNATRINYPVIMFFFIIVNIAHYQQFLRIANHNVVNHALAEQLRNASRYDFLTKLKNRTALNMDFEDSDNPNLNSAFIVMLTDIDDFKSFNDTNGHHYGDELLKRFASIMQNHFGKTHCYRYGGDEYLIVLPEIKEELFLEKINIARECTKNEFHFSGGYTHGFVSSSTDLHHLINIADKNLYNAKDAGKNQVIGSF